QKRYRGTSELILDTNSKGDELGDEDTDEDIDKDGKDEKGEEAAPEGQQQTVLVVGTTVSEPLGLRYKAARRRALESMEEIAPNTYEPTLTIWVDPEDDRVYTDIPIYPLVALVQTTLSLEW
ncbi:hypothetical protein Tco_1098294, partial [Tanacetum coccineum]